MNDDDPTLGRPTRVTPQLGMFGEVSATEQDCWWGMPSYDMADATPQQRVVINFMTDEDVQRFAELTGIPLSSTSNSAWYPYQSPLRGEFAYDGPPTPTRYPVCIPSKGRAEVQTTGKLLARMGVPHRFFVEEHEGDWYRANVAPGEVVVMPFRDLGQGSIPARNFIWRWAEERGFARHWIMDDNIKEFARCHNNRRLNVYGGGFFAAIEAFVDRYENLALIGPHGKGFVSDRAPAPPVLWNTRVYSCSLINTALPFRWRGRYNEDTDLCLRALKAGWSTAVIRALLFQKAVTAGAKGRSLPGGNTDNVYTDGDHRRSFAESLREQHPDVVRVAWRFNRWHHVVDYSPFKGNRAELRAGVTPRGDDDNFGMRLVRMKGER